MEEEYEKKFLELQKYIPFLEGMIKRLEGTNTVDINPREAQLNKIKSLRDLLRDTKKRLKMDNLLKCEQVLLNLYSKVGEADLVPNKKNNIVKTVKEEWDEPPDGFELVREKLKNVSKIAGDINVPETRSTSTSSFVSPGAIERTNEATSPLASKAFVNSVVRKVPLYERRPKRVTKSRSNSPYSQRSIDSNEPLSSGAKTPRKYTRVLCSPEPGKRWPEKISPRKNYDDEVLYQRRSPRRRRSRSHTPRSKSTKKKSRKKERGSRLGSSTSHDDVNITLNVPEESLNSLNAANIFDRIINCNENDVEIKHLRELRAQIVKELKQTGTNQDISEFILKSYKKKKKKKPKLTEIEEGELSDSESESLDKIYGNLIIEAKNDDTKNKLGLSNEKLDKVPKTLKPVLEGKERKNSPKIKISLVISKPNEDDANCLTDNKATSSQPTTTFLADIAYKESSGEESIENNKPETKKSPFFYSDLQIEESVITATTSVLTQDSQATKALCNKNVASCNNPNIPCSQESKVCETNVNKTIDSFKSPNILCSDEPKVSETNLNIVSNPVTKQLESISLVATLDALQLSGISAKNVTNDADTESKPKEFCVNTKSSQCDKDLTDLLYRDLSPCASPSSVAKISGAQKIPSEKNNKEKPDDKIDCGIDEAYCQKTKTKTVEQKDSQSIPFLSGQNEKEKNINSELISEIDILKALKNDIMREPIDVLAKSTETPSLHQPKITKVTDKSQLDIDKKRRISIENYKAKTAPVQKVNLGLFARKAEKKQDVLLRKALTPRECERFQIVLNALDDGLSDEDAQDEKFTSLGQKNSSANTDSGPKSPEEDNFSDSSNGSPILIPSYPIKCDEACDSSTTIKDVDMRVFSPLNSPRTKPTPIYCSENGNADARINNESSRNTVSMPPNKFNCNFPVSSNYKGRNPKPLLGTVISKPSSVPLLMTPSRDMLMTQSRNSSINPSRVTAINPSVTPSRNPSMTPSRNALMTPSRNPSMTPSRNLTMTPTYSPKFGDDNFTGRRHVYAPSDLPDPRRTPSWDMMYKAGARDDAILTPVWEADTIRGDKMLREVPGTPVWESDNRSPLNTENTADFGYYTPGNNPFDRTSDHNSPLDPYKSNIKDMHSTRNRSERDPRLCAERRDEPYVRDPRMAGFYHGNRVPEDIELRSNPMYPLDYDKPMSENDLRRNYDGETNRSQSRIRETSVGARHLVSYDPFSEGRTMREHGVGRHCPDERKMGYDYANESYTDGRDLVRERNFIRASSVGRSIINPMFDSSVREPNVNTTNERIMHRVPRDGRIIDRESSVGRNFDREPSMGRSMAVENNFGLGMCRESNDRRSISREQNVGRNFSRAASVGRSHERGQSVGRSMTWESKVGRSVAREKSLERNMGRAQSVGRSMGREQIVERIFAKEVSVERALDREQSLKRSIGRERSVGRSYTREPCAVGRSGREQSVGRSCTREPSVGRIVRREPSMGRSLGEELHRGREPSVGRNKGMDLTEGRNTTHEAIAWRERVMVESTSAKKIPDINDAKITGSNSRDPRSRRDLYESKSKESKAHKHSSGTSSSQASSNNSSPRIGKSVANSSKCRKDKFENKQFDVKSRKSGVDRKNQSGIVYSSDNIAKGNILEPRQGVKNYKIPKIKRPVEEPVNNDLPNTKEITVSPNLKAANSITKCKLLNNKETVIEQVAQYDEKKNTTNDPSYKKGKGKLKTKKKTNKYCLTNHTNADRPNTSPDDSDDSNEFGEILTKIKQSQVEALSDSDESIHEPNTFIRSNQINSQHTTETSKSFDLSVIADSSVDSVASSVNKEAGSSEAGTKNECMQKEKLIDTAEKVYTSMYNETADCQSNINIDKESDIMKKGEKTINVLKPEIEVKNNSSDVNSGCIVAISSEQILLNVNTPESPSCISTIGKMYESSIEDLSLDQTVRGSIVSTIEETKQEKFMTECDEKLFPSEHEIAKDPHTYIRCQNISSQSTIPYYPDDSDKKDSACSEEPKEHLVNGFEKEKQVNIDLETSSTIIDGKSEIDSSEQILPMIHPPGNVIDGKVSNNCESESSKVIETLNHEENINNISLSTTIPDSTVQNEGVQEITKVQVLPDSTNNSDINTDLSSNVSSSHDVKKNEEKAADTENEKDSQCSALQSLGSILAILQDKIKVKQIMTMIDSVETEKLIKKLAMLSQSDDTDTLEPNKSADQPDIISSTCSTLKPVPAQTDLPENKTIVSSEQVSSGTDSEDCAKVVATKQSSSVSNVASSSMAPNTNIIPAGLRSDDISDAEVLTEPIFGEANTEHDTILNDTPANFTNAETIKVLSNSSVILPEKNQSVEDKVSYRHTGDEHEVIPQAINISENISSTENNFEHLSNIDNLSSQVVSPETRETPEDQNSILENKAMNELPLSAYQSKKNYRKGKMFRRKNGKMKKCPKKELKSSLMNEKRMTRSESAQKVQVQRKRRNRELQLLQEDIRDMFISEDVLKANGIRMCRLAKLTDDVVDPVRSESEEKQESKKIAGKKCTKNISETVKLDTASSITDPKPLVVLEKSSLINADIAAKNDNGESLETTVFLPAPKIRKKPGPKPKPKVTTTINSPQKGKMTKKKKLKPGPKSRKFVVKVLNSEETLHKSSANINLNTPSDLLNQSCGSDEESLSSLASIAGSERSMEPKVKIKKKSMLWKQGKIKSKKKTNKKVILQSIIPDYNCFTDKSYCFEENTLSYGCRLCVFEGDNIVLHYKQKHSHCEVPLSRINIKTAIEAIGQSHTTDFDRFSKKHRTKIICRFCFHVFEEPKFTLEKFFWHVVSKHTGEYKYPCGECLDLDKCTSTLDIPAPPDPAQVLLLGFICGECHYTQISLNNLKTHVALRHDNEETEVYTVNLCDVPERLGKEHISQTPGETKRKLRSRKERLSRSIYSSKLNDSDNDELATQSEHDGRRESLDSPAKKKSKTKMPKFTFESDSNDENTHVYGSGNEIVKSEIEEDPDGPEDEFILAENKKGSSSRRSSGASEAAIVWENAEFVASLHQTQIIKQEVSESSDHEKEETSSPIEFDKSPHFMVTAPKEGVKSTRSYVCRIKGCRTDYRTALLISLKKHVQFKHVAWRDVWDGYCCVCQHVIGGGSTRQSGSYSDCLNHMLMKHLDHFPVLQEPIVAETDSIVKDPLCPNASLADGEKEENPEIKKYINVRPLSDLVLNKNKTTFNAVPETQSADSVLCTESVTETEVESEKRSLMRTMPSASKVSDITLECVARQPKNGEPLSSPVDAIQKVLAEKHPAVRESILMPEKLALVYKCAGKYCAFVGLTVASYLEHLHAHLTVKRDNSDVLRCAYCEFRGEQAKSLAEHALREHGHVRYSCVYCWYAATSALLVELHFARAHPDQPAHAPIAMESQISDVSAATQGMLLRSEAVPFFTCSRRGPMQISENCRFRGYTSSKYREHLEQFHKDDPALYCFVCSKQFEYPSNLIAHLKQHGLCLFQCTYCLYGTDTESEMLQHAAHYHPARRPQAYLRHILETKTTNAPGEKIKYKVLPLMRLDKEDVVRKSPSVDQDTIFVYDSPAKAVERANALERLILQHTNPIDTEMLPRQSKDMQAQSTISAPIVEQTVGPVADVSLQQQNQVAVPQLKVKSELPVNDPTNAKKNQNQTSNEYIICVDSDDEETPLPLVIDSKPVIAITKVDKTKLPADLDIIDISDDDSIISNNRSSGTVDAAPVVASTIARATPTAKNALLGDKAPRFGTDKMFKCQKCLEICKNDYFYRQHLFKCYPEPNATPQCPHCPLVLDSIKTIRIHLIRDHGPVKLYRCNICNLEDRVSKKIIQHMNNEHNVLFTTICLETPGSNMTIMRYSVKAEEGKTMSTIPAKGPRALAPPPPPLQPIPTPKAKSLPRLKPGPKSKQVVDKPNTKFGPEDISRIPLNPILDEFIQCSRCEFGTKVRSNMIRHLQMHAREIAVPSAAPVNPVPHLESNEMHFDKMTNLAASSNTLRAPERGGVPSTVVPPETAAKYPKYVPEKDRNVCGAVGCCYISLDETLLKYHWETLHTGLTHGPQATMYRCVHCPTHQQLDTSRPLTASRIIGHLKMHDARLYGCADCGYYHYQRSMVERHAGEKHGPNARGVFAIREPTDTVPGATADPRNAPTMDLKPWQCGVCKFKSMLRPEVVDHCSKSHGFKFQFKCSFCPYSGSVHTSVFRHQAERHVGRIADDVIHVYYKERPLGADEETYPLWTKQRSFLSVPNEAVKSEAGESARLVNDTNATTSAAKSPPTVDLAIVKSEVEDPPREVTLENVIALHGPFCEPKGELYLCPLCKVFTEESQKFMVTHLHEELNYRKWCCTMCSYKAFSKIRIMDHSLHEHKQSPEPTQLSPDRGIELWITKLLEHQEITIDLRKAKRKAAEDVAVNDLKSLMDSVSQKSGSISRARQELEQTFGPFGLPKGENFACPKCEFKTIEEDNMSRHLEIELAKVRWTCSQCSIKFQHYHEAQRHCTVVTHSSFAHVSVVSKDPSQRASWIEGVISTQGQIKNKPRGTPIKVVAVSADSDSVSTRSESAENSLLVERYAEEMPGPSRETETTLTQPSSRKRKRNPQDHDSDEDSSCLVINEKIYKCAHCDYTSRWNKQYRTHCLRHFNLKSHICGHCPFSSSRDTMKKHAKEKHPNEPYLASTVRIPQGAPLITGNLPRMTRKRSKAKKEKSTPMKVDAKASKDETDHVCLLCDEELGELDVPLHQATVHAGLPQQVVVKGTLVRKCATCMALRADADSLQLHHDTLHPGQELNYSLFKVGFDKRLFYACAHCSHVCRFIQDLKCHHNTVHAMAGLPFKHNRKPCTFKPQSSSEPLNIDGIDDIHSMSRQKQDELRPSKRNREEDDLVDVEVSNKRVAKKSTTKLPCALKATARKSTTKLPSCPINEHSNESYSYYGTKLTPVEKFGHVNTKMAFYDTMMPITVKKLSEIVNISPIVLVSDVIKSSDKNE